MDRINVEEIPGELKALAGTMNEMAEMVQLREKALPESEDRNRDPGKDAPAAI